MAHINGDGYSYPLLGNTNHYEVIIFFAHFLRTIFFQGVYCKKIVICIQIVNYRMLRKVGGTGLDMPTLSNSCERREATTTHGSTKCTKTSKENSHHPISSAPIPRSSLQHQTGQCYRDVSPHVANVRHVYVWQLCSETLSRSDVYRVPILDRLAYHPRLGCALEIVLVLTISSAQLTFVRSKLEGLEGGMSALESDHRHIRAHYERIKTVERD